MPAVAMDILEKQWTWREASTGNLYRLDLWRIEGSASPVDGECPDPKARPRDPMAEGSVSGMYGISDRYRLYVGCPPHQCGDAA